MRSSCSVVSCLNGLKFLLNVGKLGREGVDLRVDICVCLHDLLENLRLHLLHIVRVVIGLLDPFLLGHPSSVYLLELSAPLFLDRLDLASLFDLLLDLVNQELFSLDCLVEFFKLFLLIASNLSVISELNIKETFLFVLSDLSVHQLIEFLFLLHELVTKLLVELFERLLLDQKFLNFLSLMRVKAGHKPSLILFFLRFQLIS